MQHSIDDLTAPFFPLQKGRAYFRMASGVELVLQKCRQVLGTAKGGRFMRRSFGSNIHLRRFEPNDEALRVLVRQDIVDALDAWVPEVQVHDDGITFDPIDPNHRLRYTAKVLVLSTGSIESVNGELQLER